MTKIFMKNLATITIKEIAIDCILGVGDKERETKQTILVTVIIQIDATKASKTDNVEDTVNYSFLYRKIIEKVSTTQYYLLEALVSYILALCLEEEGILHAIVRVEKPTVLPGAKGVILEMSGRNE
jgi:D-erythro-7,8-dihydroneopterin triphosphate epimerase